MYSFKDVLCLVLKPFMNKSHAFIKPVRGKSFKDTGIRTEILFHSTIRILKALILPYVYKKYINI